MVNCYIPPANSTRKGGVNNPSASFDFLHDTLNNIKEDPVNDDIVLCGDLNARIGVTPDFREQYCRIDSFIFSDDQGPIKTMSIPTEAPISAHRNSSDKGTNSQKKRLLDLVESQNMLILNGRTFGDSTGKYTCFKWNGNSVVDYFITTPNFLHRVKSLSVCEHTLFSDHNPILLSLNHNKTNVLSNNEKPTPTYEDAPRRFLITPESLRSFKVALEDIETAEEIERISNWADEANCDRTSVERLNQELSSLIQKAASNAFDVSKPPAKKKPGYSPWFDDQCQTARRLMKRSAKVVDQFPDKKSIKDRHRANNKSYRLTLNNKRDKFLEKLNQKIKSGKSISWKDLKKLKRYSKADPNIKTDYLDNFQDFYQKLYADEHPTIDQLTKEALMQDADLIANAAEPTTTLNSPFTLDELDTAIKSLKTGKASSFDMISNEIIKALNPSIRQLLLKLFNWCLLTGTYLWEKSVITPLHKKGSVSNPDNYRAIAVCSCLGKLLSVMLLTRLIAHRSTAHPDPPNQAGFTKGSQCNDHIFALLTIAEKYKKTKGKIYAVFVDLKKAFDLVCRQALLFKLACYGVNGGFYNLIKNMYQKSSGQIKLNGKLSKIFRILKGTEQGHPLSPELFKVYFKELSDLLNEASVTLNCPSLSGLTISHLAWADDLVILALDPNSLQKLLDILADYCRKWGLEVNISKTKFMVINGRVSSANTWRPTLNNAPIELVSSYCYLGVIICNNGKFKQAIDALYRKGLGAYFALRNTVDRRFIDAKSLDKLFETLVTPILMYGCQIWLPTLPCINKLLNNMSMLDLKQIAKLPAEQVHLRHLKYLLGINRRSCNSAAWGETGKFPLFIKGIVLSINYFKRLNNLEATSIAKAALCEQTQLQLSWYSSIKQLIVSFGDVNTAGIQTNTSETLNANILCQASNTDLISQNIQEKFKTAWSQSVNSSSKLAFYSSIKNSFGWESYIDHALNFMARRSTAQIRCSAHKLHIETGRHLNTAREDRTCVYCHKELDRSIIDDENHLLHSCPSGLKERELLKQRIMDTNILLDQSFNLAHLYPPQSQEITPESEIAFIRASTKAIHVIYQQRLKYLKSIRKTGPK